MSPSFRLLFLCTCFVFLFPVLGHSQNEVHTMREVVVTGTRTDKLVSDAPVKTELLTKQAIEERHYKSAAEALEDLAGVSLVEDVRRPGQSALLQGLGEEHVLVLVDGVPQAQTAAAGYDLSQISTESIERIEVIKGAASALYGSEAMGGVIHVITKKPEGQVRVHADLQTGAYLHQEGNEGSPYSVSGGVSGTAAGLGYRAQVSVRRREGMDLDPSTVAQDSDAIRKLNGSLLLEKRWESQDRVWAKYTGFDENVHGVNSQMVPMVGPEPRDNISRLHSHEVVIGGEKALGGENRVRGYVSASMAEDEFLMEDNPKTAWVEDHKSSRMRTFRTEIQWDQLMFENHFFSTGLTYSYMDLDQLNLTTLSAGSTVETRDVDDKSISSLAAFVQDDIIFDHWELVPGVRAEYDGDYGTNISPKVTAKWNGPKLGGAQSQIRASVGTGYRVPSLKERFYLLDHTSLAGYIVLGDESLTPEKSINYQLGWDVTYRERANFYLNVFYNDVRGLIDTQLVDSYGPLDTYRYTNIGRVDIQGAEARVLIQPTRWLTWDTSYTYSDVRDRSTGRQIAFRPYAIARGSLKLSPENEKFSVLTVWRHHGEQTIDDLSGDRAPAYSTWDVKMNWQLEKNAALYWGVDNVFNVTREPVSDFGTDPLDPRPRIGTFYYLGLKISGS